MKGAIELTCRRINLQYKIDSRKIESYERKLSVVVVESQALTKTLEEIKAL